MLLNVLVGCVTFVFFVVFLLYFLLLFFPRAGRKAGKKSSSLAVIIPAHNEERHIAECLDSVLSAGFGGKKEVIVVNDGSTDGTADVLKRYEKSGVKIFTTPHRGKAEALNKGISASKSELIAVVDADSVISGNSLLELQKEMAFENVGAACCVVKVRNRRSFIGMWLHVEQIYNSLLRSLLAKVNANIVTPGPLSMYSKKAVEDVGGFSPYGFSEDVDISVRLIRKGYDIAFSEKCFSETVMPQTPGGFLKQRFRFVRGTIDIFKKHLKPGKKLIDVYTLPLFLFNYIQALVVGISTIYQVVSGYLAYFVSKGVLFSFSVLKFFFEWFSLFGFVKWAYGNVSGAFGFNIVSFFSIAATLLSYVLLFTSVLRYDRKIDFFHAVPLFFMFPFWLLIMTVNVLASAEFFRKGQKNIWEKFF